MGVGAGLTCPEFSRWSETLNFLQRLGNIGWTSLPEIGIIRSGGTRHQEATRRVPEAGPDPKLADRKGVVPLARARAKGSTEAALLIRLTVGSVRRWQVHTTPDR
jgi:hypothetical protein